MSLGELERFLRSLLLLRDQADESEKMEHTTVLCRAAETHQLVHLKPVRDIQGFRSRGGRSLVVLSSLVLESLFW